MTQGRKTGVKNERIIVWLRSFWAPSSVGYMASCSQCHSDQVSENHGQLWASGKLFPWKQLPQRLGQNALVCVNWLVVLFPGQECSSHSKPKGISDLTIVECTQIVAAIRDNRLHKLHFKFNPFSKRKGPSSCYCS